ncbi:MAG: class I SAM-dependent methyltransferase [Planctomycetes bacterium]|nr:class I SAM-dependent methyltransferase [Planctomycetota bacterium]
MPPSIATLPANPTRKRAPLAPRSRDEQRRALIREQFVDLHADFDRSRPSQPLCEIVRRTVVNAIEARHRATGRRVRVLEVGCGVGNWAEYLLAASDENQVPMEYLGLDFAPPCVQSCNRRIGNRVGSRAVVADFESLTPDSSYDVVFFVEVFCHLRKHQDDEWLRKASQWLAPGGALIIVDKERHSRHGWRVRWDLFKRTVLPASWRGRGYYFPEKYNTLLTTLRYPHFRHLAGTMKRAGLRVQPIERHGLFNAVVGCRES